MQNVSLKSLQEKFARRCSRRHKQTTFSDADFLGALRIKWWADSKVVPNSAQLFLGKHPGRLYGKIAPFFPYKSADFPGNEYFSARNNGYWKL